MEPDTNNKRGKPADGLEIRAFSAAIEIRDDSAGPLIVGHAAVFDQLSSDLGGWRELIKPGTFAGTILEDDPAAVWNHNTDLVLGRKSAGTLRLAEDAQGLAVEIDPPDTTWARDHVLSMRRGDVRHMSFGFRVKAGGASFDETDAGIVRTVTAVRLIEVSPVAFPAYPQTDVAVRSLREWLGELDAEIVECSGCGSVRRKLSLLERRMRLIESLTT